MNYKLCQRCQFRVPSRTRLCHVCGSDSFISLALEHDNNGHVVKNKGILEKFASMFQEPLDNDSVSNPPTRNFDVPTYNYSHKQESPAVAMAASTNDKSLDYLRKSRQQQLDRLRNSFKEYEVNSVAKLIQKIRSS